jgi:hypothetical protein
VSRLHESYWDKGDATLFQREQKREASPFSNGSKKGKRPLFPLFPTFSLFSLFPRVIGPLEGQAMTARKADRPW